MRDDTVAPPSAYRQFRRRLLLACAALAALLAALLSWIAWSGYEDDRRTAFIQTRSFAQAMSAHVGSEMRVVDLSLQRSAEALGKLDPAALRNRARVREILGLSASTDDANFWLHFVDADGVGVVASNGLSIGGVSYRDRPYFAVHQQRRDAGLFVGAPQTGRVSKRRVFFLSRGVYGPDGSLLGVVVAPVDAGVLAEVFASARFQPSLSILLLHGDGLAIARVPLFEPSFARDLRQSELMRHWRAAPSGSYKARSMIDGEVRIVSYQTVGQLPLVVAVGIAAEPWVRAVGKELAIGAVALAALGLVLGLSVRFSLRSFQRIEQSDLRQRQLNDALRLARDDMARAEKRMRMVADSLPALVAYIDADERYVFHNSFYRHIPGVDIENMDGRTMREVLGDDIYLSIRDRVHEVLGGANVRFEQAMRAGELERHLKYDYMPDVDSSGKVLGFYTMVLDITEAKETEQILDRMARTDSLTGLPNRNQVNQRLAEALARARRGGAQVGCLYLDIDRFKAINDTLGHAGGDEVLRQFGRRLSAAVRETDLVARLAGDEFVIVLEGCVQPASAHEVATKIVASMHAPFVIDGVERTVGTSIGVAIGDGADDVDAILRRADAALYRAKAAGRGGFTPAAF